MSLIIDGYNLLHVSRFAPVGRRADRLSTSRENLLEFLAQKIPPHEFANVAIVFDSERQSRRLPDRFSFRHLRVFFARDHLRADDLIEELIRSDPSPKKLLVVSSDHRIQQAAKRRGAAFVDSDIWIEQFECDVDELIEQPDDGQSTFDREAKSDDGIGFDNPFPEGYGDDLGLDNEFR